MNNRIALSALLLCIVFGSNAAAQTVIRYITPDIGAQGTTVAVEIIGDYNQPGAFGTPGPLGIAEPPIIHLVNPADSNRLVIGPQIVSWDGRMVQCMFFVRENRIYGDVPITATGALNSANFASYFPEHVGVLSGGATFTMASPHNSYLFDSLILTNGNYTFTTTDADSVIPGNEGYLPVRVFSLGPIRLENATLSVAGQDGSTGNGGGNAGPGGGGGGAGMPGNGGAGYTGGGGVGEQSNHAARHGGDGTGTARTHYYDGAGSLNNAPGGIGTEHGNPAEYNDEGGGGGTGLPFGYGGQSGVYKTDSRPGGYGGGTGGGTATSSGTTNYGGGGGGFATEGNTGQGNGNNGGQANGNRMLVPLAGGSGGASGNVSYVISGKGGSGGGGGGAIDLTSYTQFDFESGLIDAHGGNGSSGNIGFDENGAGGGGASGGGVIIRGRDSVTIGTATTTPGINVNGGNGGGGYKNGGDGGLGRVRIDGLVSATTGDPNVTDYYLTGKDFVGPTIRSVISTDTNLTVYGTSGGFDTTVTDTILLRYAYGSDINDWFTLTIIPTYISTSHTPVWSIVIPTPTRRPADSLMYLVAMQKVQPQAGSYTYVPQLIMSHLSGYIDHHLITYKPFATLEPDTIDFGSIRLGECRDTTALIKNTGLGTLNITSETLSEAHFTSSDPLPIQVQPGDSVLLHLRFCPTDTTHLQAIDTIASDAPQSPQLLVLLGAGKTSILASSLDSIDFGDVSLTACKDSSFWIYNVGNDTAFLTTSTLSNPHFTVVQPTLPTTIAEHDSLECILRFCPSDTSVVTGVLTITDTLLHSLRIGLRGHAVQASVIADTGVAFGCMIIGRTYTATMHLENTGNIPDTIAMNAITGSNLVTIAGALQPILLPHTIDSVMLSITPTATGPFRATLEVTWHAGTGAVDTSADFVITGNVSNPPALVVLPDTAMKFGIVPVNDVSTPNCVTLTNYSCEALSLDSIIIVGPTTFRIVTDPAPNTLGDSTTATACIAFAPVRNGPDSAVAIFFANGDTVQIPLYGTGLAPETAVTLALDTIYGTAGQTVAMHASVTNDITAAAITTATFRIQFDPMQLDLKSPIAGIASSATETPTANSVASPFAGPTFLTNPTITDHAYSLGDHAITVTSSQPMNGAGILATLPFEILLPSANTAEVHITDATFGTANARLASATPGSIAIAECDTTERILLDRAPIIVHPTVPNPVATHTIITFDATASGHVAITLFNVLGQRVRTIFDADITTGTYHAIVDASTLPPGMYEYVTTWTNGSEATPPIHYRFTITR